ncbi:MAG: hypothetical protein ACTSQ1_12110 [Promethearchaeota archaeon]|jgi:hypothetical protein
MTKDIDWKNFRHPKFLQSLSLTSNEFKFLNLFLKQGKFERVEKIENREISRLFTTSNNPNSSSYYTKEKIGIDI